MEFLQQVEVHDQAGEHDGNGGDQLDQDVQRGAGGVLEGVAHGVADNGGLVVVAALAAVVSFFDMFLGVVPGASRIGHEDRQYEPGSQAADQQSDHSCHSEYQTGEDRCDDG